VVLPFGLPKIMDFGVAKLDAGTPPPINSSARPSIWFRSRRGDSRSTVAPTFSRWALWPTRG
jgi:hypothetical protein